MRGSAGIPLIERAMDPARAGRIAVVDNAGAYTYGELLSASAAVASRLLAAAAGTAPGAAVDEAAAGTVQAAASTMTADHRDRSREPADLGEARVAYLVPPGFAHVAVQWGIWRAGGIAVPLCATHPRPELEHVILDSGASVVVAPEDFELPRAIARDHGITFLAAEAALQRGESHLPDPGPSPRPGGCALPGPGACGRAAPFAAGRLPYVHPDRGALILYTSGTTSKPKGVLTSHRNVAAQVETLITAWEWNEDDAIPHFLPLHHIHGLVNILTCALWAGARCRFFPRFDAGEVWDALIHENFTLFMAVPTIYAKMIAAWESADPARKGAMSAACRKLRLMVSGSAALPVSTLEAWRKISGHTLLERYGMTEIGMAISNPLHGERRPGTVGVPLPGVEVMLADEQGRPVPPGTPGEIYVKGPGVFRGYWNNPEATKGAFRHGWFRTGDVAVLEDGYYRILGRASVDIIKTGGYKVSALEIEEVLRTHPAVAECAVVGAPDPEWGERVSAAVVLKSGSRLSLEELRAWAKERMAPYKVPTRLLVVAELPRNAMGKVTKPVVAAWFNREGAVSFHPNV